MNLTQVGYRCPECGAMSESDLPCAEHCAAEPVFTSQARQKGRLEIRAMDGSRLLPCAYRDCGTHAGYCLIVQTPRMSAPAFYYHCTTHTRLIADLEGIEVPDPNHILRVPTHAEIVSRRKP